MEEWGWWNKCNYRTLISATPEAWEGRGPSCKQIYSRGTGPPPPTLQPQSCPASFVKHLNDDWWWCKTYILIIVKQIESVGCLCDEEDDCVDILNDGPHGDGLHGPPEAPPVLLVIPEGGEVGPEDDAVDTERDQGEEAHQSHLDSLQDEEVSLLSWGCHSTSLCHLWSELLSRLDVIENIFVVFSLTDISPVTIQSVTINRNYTIISLRLADKLN